MVEIIGQDQAAAKQITHKNCGAVLRYYPKDVQVLTQGRDWTGDACGTEGFTCPQCGKPVITSAW
jgi:transcription initiation factor IIE alpha subunit